MPCQQKSETVHTIGFGLLFFLTEKPCKSKSSGNRGFKLSLLLPELFCFPDGFLNAYKTDYQWLSRVYESVKPTDGRGGLIWASLGAKTIELVHQNLTVGEADEDMEILAMDADLIDDFLEKQKEMCYVYYITNPVIIQ